MALFNNKEAENNQRLVEAMQKYHVSDLSDPRDVADMERILNQLSQNGGMRLADTNKALEQELNVMAARYTLALFEQNNIIIRQLERLNRNLENMKEKQNPSGRSTRRGPRRDIPKGVKSKNYEKLIHSYCMGWMPS